MRGRCAAALLVVAAVVAAGCGAEDVPNDPRPPAPIELSVKVDNHNVEVVPDVFGAGLVTVTISNQSSDDVELNFNGPKDDIPTDLIPAGGIRNAQFELGTGNYTVETSISTIVPGHIIVGPERPSASNDLQLP
jgi:hypothetical protein